MKKLFIGSAIAALVIFIAGAASAVNPVCTSTACTETGTLKFAAADGTTVTSVQNVNLTLTKVPNTMFWTGTLVIPSTSAILPSTTINLSAIKAPDMSDDPHLFRDIAGTDAATGEAVLRAEGRNNATNSAGVHGFGFHGTIHFSGFVGSFQGPLFPLPAP